MCCHGEGCCAERFAFERRTEAGANPDNDTFFLAPFLTGGFFDVFKWSAELGTKVGLGLVTVRSVSWLLYCHLHRGLNPLYEKQ